MTEAYTSSGYSEGYPEGIEHHFWHAARNDLIVRQLKKVLRPDELILDIGCGAGVFVDYAQGKGLNIRGVEKGPAPVKPGLESIVDTGMELSELAEDIRGEVRVALLLDVIEHIEDRTRFLSQVRQQLPRCEYLLVTVPARMEIWSNFDEYWGHFLRYDRPALEAELQEAGFDPIKSAYHFNWVYLASLIMRPLGIKRKTDFTAPSRNPLVIMLHKLLAWLTVVESRLVPGWMPGSTILCLARRQP
jgi:SAM-dependent methyltransferase